MNQVSLIGRLVRSVQLQQIAPDRAVVNNTLAVNRYRKGDDGQTLADFVPIVFWNKSAELVDRYCQKGSLIGVNGHLASRSYVNKQEQQVFVLELVVDDLHFIEPRKENVRPN